MVSTATGGGLDGYWSAANSRLSNFIVPLSPRLPGNPVDLAVEYLSTSGAIALFRLSSSGTVVAGSVEIIEDGAGGIPGGTVDGSSFGRIGRCGDLDGDGRDDLLAGSRYGDAGGTWSGAIYILYMNPGGAAVPVRQVV